MTLLVPCVSAGLTVEESVTVVDDGVMTSLECLNFQLKKTMRQAMPDIIRVPKPDKAMDMPIRRLL